MFSKKEVKEIQKLLWSEFGLDASPKEAYQYMAQLLDILLATYQKESAHSKKTPP